MKKFSGLLTLLCFPLTSHAALSGWVQPFSVISAGDTAWVMLSAILVLFMTIPGLALFYAGMAMVTTQISAAVGALAWIFCEACYRHKPSALGLASGAVAGLVGITPAAGFVDAQSAVFIGFITSVICFFSVTKLKYKLGYDDSLDAFGIHGIGGIVGAVLTGIFVSDDITGSEGASLWIQIESVLITLVYSSAVSFALLWGMSKFMTLRVERDEERQGLDLTSHGERLE